MLTKDFFVKNKIIHENKKALDCFCKICPDFTIHKKLKPSECIKFLWEKYLKCENNNNNLNGKVFELIIAAVLVNAKISPFYMNAKVYFVPGVNYDFLLYAEEDFPIVLSAKTSLRERWKQADLEAFALHNVNRKSKSYLISLDKETIETRVRQKDEWLGLNDIIYCLSDDFDNLIKRLSSQKFVEPKPINIIESQTLVR